MSEPMSLRTRVLLSVQRALWDRVTPDLRGVAASWQDGVRARFIYEVPLSSELRELVREAETEVIADFAPTFAVSFIAEHLPTGASRQLADSESWVYLRRE